MGLTGHGGIADRDVQSGKRRQDAGWGAAKFDERIALMRPQIQRLRADIACLQEVHGQERPGQARALLTLQKLLAGTYLDGANLVSTVDTAAGAVSGSAQSRRRNPPPGARSRPAAQQASRSPVVQAAHRQPT
jgi:hypothetical protein